MIADSKRNSSSMIAFNSEKMVLELNERKNKFINKLINLEKKPQTQAEKRGKILESLRLAEEEKTENETYNN